MPAEGRFFSSPFFFSHTFHWQVSDGLPTKKGVKQTSARARPPRVWHQHQANAAAAPVRGGTAALFLHEHKDGTLASAGTLASRYVAETGLGAAYFPAEVKSTGAPIIMALIGINREWTAKATKTGPEDGPRLAVWWGERGWRAGF